MWKMVKVPAVLVAVGAFVGLVASGGCTQPKPKCGTGRGAFFARYTLTGGPSTCADRKSEILGLQVYNPMGEKGNPNLDRNIVAIGSESLGTLVDHAAEASLGDPDDTRKPYALGEFTTPEPVDDICEIPTLAPAQQSIPLVPESTDADGKVTPAQPATEVIYEWTNFQTYVVPQAIGAQFKAHLKLTQDGVACDYDVQALYPAVPCGKKDPNNEGGEIPDPTACEPEANIDAGHTTGSGINPDFPVVCEPELLHCVLTGTALPTLR